MIHPELGGTFNGGPDRATVVQGAMETPLAWNVAGTLIADLREAGLLDGLAQPSDAGQREGSIQPLVDVLAGRLARASHVSTEDVAAQQQSMLARLVSDAVVHVPYYRESLAPQKGVGPIDIDQLPLLTRQILRTQWEELVSEEAHATRCVLKVTSGTSGMPVSVLLSEDESFATLHYDVARVACVADFVRRPRWQSPIILGVVDNPTHPPFSTYNPILQKLCRFEIIDPLQPNSVIETLKHIDELQPAVLVSRPSALRLLADMAAHDSARGTERLMIISSGSNLYPDDRARIAAALHADIADLYAISECSGVASQCLPHGRFHVHWESALVEIINPLTSHPVGENEPGEIVVTDLSRRAMPVIRYRTGDWAQWAPGPCPCGRSGPALAGIDGRDGCYFPIGDGQLFNPSVLNYPLAGLSDLDQYRVIQVREDAMLVEFIPAKDAPSDLGARIVEIVTAAFPKPVHVSSQRVSQIGTPGAKVQRYVSRLTSRGQGAPATGRSGRSEPELVPAGRTSSP